MYLDTDIILALVKETDWLKPHVNLSKLVDPKTSTLTIIEGELVMEREYGREHVKTVLEIVKRHNIKILPLTQEIIETSKELLMAHPELNIFDSVHAAFSIQQKETILSTDAIFKRLPLVTHVDPRHL